MYTIRKSFTFSAAHHLVGLDKGHPCARQHGHNYIVEVLLTGKLNSNAFVLDYRKLDKFKKFIDKEVDHRDLNVVFPDMPTTAENLAYRFYRICKDWWPETCMVRVSETPKTWAEFSI